MRNQKCLHHVLVVWSRSKQADDPSESRWSTSPMDTRNPRGVTGTLPVSREGIGYLMEGELMERDRHDGRE
ncbi:hypothetical protein EVAR_97861_1 [Eumeta japonica]|uniref:Uncharacterized protein n=1 Tax=Eumeta variegata TaxID=151549 RepID=A0A4C1WXN3_EUMVA|nr:hypothetical protein EVAR_97861_1 [Eumeta japonica]